MQLVEKSIGCMVSAIEIYNKPDFKYREELFCILVVNAWELLVKAKILRDNNNNPNSIYVREYLRNKDGSKSKKWKYKINRANNFYTIDIFGALKRLLDKKIIDRICFENIETIIEIRDNSIHFYNAEPLLKKKIQELGTASIESYLTYMRDWFSISLEKYNFYLMPMSFFNPDQVIPVLIGNRDNSVDNLLKYIAAEEEKYPSKETSQHNITIAIQTKFVKPDASDITKSQKISLTSDESAPKVQISIEDISKTHPLDYKSLTNKMKIRYSDFKVNNKYHELRKVLEQDQKFCFHYPQNPQNPTGASKPLFSINVFQEFDKSYKRKVTK